MAKSFTVKIDPEYQDTFERYCEEKDATQKDAAQYFVDTGLRRKTSLYADRDKAGKKRPSSGATKKKTKKKASTKKKTTKKKAATKSAKKTTKKKKTSRKNSNGSGLTAAQKSAIAKLKEDGFNNKDIAEQLDLSKDQVYRAIKSMK